MIKKMLSKLWGRYDEFLDWLMDTGERAGGYVLMFSLSIGMGLMIGLFISELIK